MLQERILYDTCPLCDSKEIAFEQAGDCSGHSAHKPPLSTKVFWMRCAACGHSFTEGYFTPEALDLVFETVCPNQGAGENLEANRLVSAQMVEKVLPFAREGRWLDVGFGNGSLVFTADEYGFEVTALDLRAQPVAQMQAIGFDARCENLLEVEFERPFDVVSMCDVLEHVPHPKEFLAAAHRALRPGGVLFLSMPNADATLWEVMNSQNANPYWGEIEHYHNFGRARLYRLLEEAGFRPERYGISRRYRCCMEVIATRR